MLPMKKEEENYKGFTLVELLLVMGISIILSAVGYNGFLSIRESFTARENVELIIQDIESTKLKAMNMESGKDATWIYGFGIDFTEANDLDDMGDYTFFKWCSPVEEYGATFLGYGKVTENILPNLSTTKDLDELINDYPLCNTNGPYQNGRIPTCYYLEECILERTGLIKTNEFTTLLDREKNQMEILPNYNTGLPSYPLFLVFESLTGRAIIYNDNGLPQGYAESADGVVFNRNDIVPLDIVLHRKRSDKFDLITVYPNSGEVIHHVYDKIPTGGGHCDGSYNALEFFQVDGGCYVRYGIKDEINSFRS